MLTMTPMAAAVIWRASVFEAGARQGSVQVSFKLDTINGCGDDECLSNGMLHDSAYYSARERVRTTGTYPPWTMLPNSSS